MYVIYMKGSTYDPPASIKRTWTSLSSVKRFAIALPPAPPAAET